MEYFEFESLENVTDERAVFANRICKLIYEKHHGEIDKSVDDVADFADHLEELVRNIYELELSEIPLIALHRLRNNGADNYGFSDQEYKIAEHNCKRACFTYYAL